MAKRKAQRSTRRKARGGHAAGPPHAHQPVVIDTQLFRITLFPGARGIPADVQRKAIGEG